MSRFKVGDKVWWKLNTIAPRKGRVLEGFGKITDIYEDGDYDVDSCEYMLELQCGDEMELEEVYHSPLFKALS